MIHHLVIGAGITGLTLAWTLKKRFPEQKILVLEKTERAGGWIRTVEQEGFLFELGPHSCRGEAVLQLSKEIGLEEEIVWAEESASRRYLYYQNELEALPKNFRECLSAFWLYPAFWGLLTEPFRKRSDKDDESVRALMERRLGKSATALLIDPLVKGIYGGDIDVLSSKWAFPKLYQWEKRYGSFVLGALRAPKKTKTPIFSFKKGMESLPQALYGTLREQVLFNRNVEKIESTSVVCDTGEVFRAQQIYDTRPRHENLPYLGLHVVCLGYRQADMPYKGFGYLIPSSEKQQVLGVIWDSCVFPQQNRTPDEVRITVMLQEGVSDVVQTVIEAVQRQMGVVQRPDSVHYFHAKNAIVQFPVGYWIEPSLVHQLGTHVSGVSLEDCVAFAQKMASV